MRNAFAFRLTKTRNPERNAVIIDFTNWWRDTATNPAAARLSWIAFTNVWHRQSKVVEKHHHHQDWIPIWLLNNTCGVVPSGELFPTINLSLVSNAIIIAAALALRVKSLENAAYTFMWHMVVSWSLVAAPNRGPRSQLVTTDNGSTELMAFSETLLTTTEKNSRWFRRMFPNWRWI